MYQFLKLILAALLFLTIAACDTNTVKSIPKDRDTYALDDTASGDENNLITDSEQSTSDTDSADKKSDSDNHLRPDDTTDNPPQSDADTHNQTPDNETADTQQTPDEEPLPDTTEIPDTVTNPDSTQPDAFVPDTTVPDITGPDTTVPDTVTPDSAVPDTVIPDTFIPDTALPDIDTVQPDLFKPDTAVPDTALPDIDTYDADTAVPDNDTFLDDALAGISKKNMQDDVTYLASAECTGRNNNTTGSQKARDYIIAELTAAGVTPGSTGSTWTQAFNYYCGYTSTKGTNIVGIIEGSDPKLKSEYVVIGAHYDHLGIKSSQTYYGADDNASGTAMMIELARVLYSIKSHLARSVVFMGFDAEEDGLCGSDYYVDHPLYPLASTVYMINLDMVGYLRSNALELYEAKSSSWAVDVFDELAKKYGFTLTYLDDEGDISDHAPFINKNVPAVFMSTGMEDVYHKPADTADKVNYDGMVSVAQYTAEFAYRVNTTTDPIYLMLQYMLERTERPFLDHGVRTYQSN